MRIWCTKGVIVRLEAFRNLYTKKILLRDCHHVQLTVSCIHLQEIWSLGNKYGSWILLIFYSVTLRTPPQPPWRNPGKRRWRGSGNPHPMDSYPTGNCCRWLSSVGMIWDKSCWCTRSWGCLRSGQASLCINSINLFVFMIIICNNGNEFVWDHYYWTFLKICLDIYNMAFEWNFPCII